MAQMCWEEVGSQFRLVCPPFGGVIDPSRPGCGLHELEIEGRKLSGSHLLGIRWLTPHQSCTATLRLDSSEELARRGGCVLRDCWTCGCDLLAEYVPQVGEDASLVVRWRAVANSDNSCPGPLTIDVLLSLQSLEFETYARVCVASMVETAEVWVPSDQGGTQLRILGLAEDFAGGQVPLSVIKVSRNGWWYQEMAHPHDISAAGVQWRKVSCETQSAGSTSDPTMQSVSSGYLGTWYRLFSDRVERGLIVRARVRGRFFKAESPAAHWLKGWEAFVNASVPLGD
jgi:hypothetical protein